MLVGVADDVFENDEQYLPTVETVVDRKRHVGKLVADLLLSDAFERRPAVRINLDELQFNGGRIGPLDAGLTAGPGDVLRSHNVVENVVVDAVVRIVPIRRPVHRENVENRILEIERPFWKKLVIGNRGDKILPLLKILQQRRQPPKLPLDRIILLLLFEVFNLVFDICENVGAKIVTHVARHECGNGGLNGSLITPLIPVPVLNDGRLGQKRGRNTMNICKKIV